jgi:glutathione synthase/RimK-type ligase-like ATP-grasp enzyme
VRVALVTAAVARGLDDDLPPLTAALSAAGVSHAVVDWDDPGVDWAAFELVVVRSVWDYTRRRDELLAWADRVAALTRLANPAGVLRWNSDKRYLNDLGRAGVPVVPTAFAAPGEAVAWPDADEVVVKPAVSAGALDTERYPAARRADAQAHVARLHADGRTAMVQPYLRAVEDERAETLLVMLGGDFSHALRKGPLLVPGLELVGGLYVEEDIRPATPTGAELRAAEAALAAVPGDAGDLLYARVDLVGGEAGPVLMELELVEPSLFLAHAPGGADRVARAITRLLRATGPG